MADLSHRLDTRPCFGDTESVAGEDLLVTLRMQLREALRELELFPVNLQRTIGPLLALYRVRRQAFRIDRKEITHARFLQLQVACYAVKTHHMHDILLHRTKNPLQHIVEMYADVRRDSSGLMHIAFPGTIIPFAAARDIRQIHVVDLIFRSFLHFLLQRTDLLMQP